MQPDASVARAHAAARSGSFMERLNAEWHKPALFTFMFVVIAHLAEHLVQAYQVYVLNWPTHASRGVLGQWFPWLVHAEILHYGYALVMLAVLWLLRSGFEGRSYVWWMAAFWIQVWHHFEHALLQGQAIAGHNLFGADVPTSVAQLWIPRVELHLLYNSLVFVPMIVAMAYHLFPPPGEAPARCACAVRPRVSLA
ncbi:MAG: hypothetical protein ACRELC_05880 [Gemmatimonadota bacterium]